MAGWGRVIGMISGTSVDAIDVALVEIHPDGAEAGWRLADFREYPWPDDLRAAILDAMEPTRGGTVDRLCHLDFALGECFAAAALALLAERGEPADSIDLIGCHGQTFYHRPDPAPVRPGAATAETGATGDRWLARLPAATRSTLQLAAGAVIAERTGAATICDFRSADIAAGGHAAPLVPYLDFLLFRSRDRGRALQNIGGIGNVTHLPPGCTAADVLAFDNGPGNALIDAAVEIVTGGARRLDEDGRLAASGRVHEPLLNELMAHPFLAEPPPKSTGRELFGRPFVRALLRRWTLPPADLVATLTAFTAAAIADSYRRILRPRGPVDEVIVAGGGARNPVLMRMLAERCAPAEVLPIDRLGLSSAAKEAVAFAVMADQALRGRTTNIPAATGASRPVILGALYPGRRGWPLVGDGPLRA